MPKSKRPGGKDIDKYLPFMYNGSSYPRLARNFLENKESITQKQRYDPSWSITALGMYRTLRPRMLCYLDEQEITDRNGNRRTVTKYDCRFVTTVSLKGKLTEEC